ncbi:MAG TPA: beta-ketoacyl synthase N-terminal-like domain-containing protein [Pyrinomonadaceae bacterium]|nr:beta-ketoacyl synthase N-terminal-like domain-containing protein [Pyrinomonadaceae bacterium]
MSNTAARGAVEEVAIVGMAGRFPGARSVAEFWGNVRDGVESVSFFTEEELAAAGVAAAALREPNYVRAAPVLDGVEMFDAAFFGFTPREAEVTDPQHRLFLECAWEAMEDAGYVSEQSAGRVGVFAGSGPTRYLLNLLSRAGGGAAAADIFQILIGNEKDHLTAKVSYKLNLTGPSINVQTACSSSLVAVALACQSLLAYQCDAALAGGVSISLPQVAGYLYQEGGIASPDGHCRAFDRRARGTVAGSGAGVVFLKRLSEALAAGDRVHAVIRGAAVNNDGAARIGYTAPGVDGQAEVIAEALAVAGVEPESVGLVEAHGTATPLGDPIEIAALTEAFRRGGDLRRAACAVGSVKTNVGHLDAAAGVAGLIKTVEALKHGQLPPSLHFECANPAIDFASGPFYVNAELREWPRGETRRRAGVSSFGIGGTNAHLVLEEPPPPARADEPARAQLLVLSARSAPALEQAAANLAAHLRRGDAGAPLADVAYTLQVGRESFAHRMALVCEEAGAAAEMLEAREPSRVFVKRHEGGAPGVALMFPGQGAQHVRMAAGLYADEPTFRRELDRCAEALGPHAGRDLREVLYPEASRLAEAEELLRQTAVAQPALFSVCYALAKVWEAWGVRPSAMIGHSVGEYVAACLAGVFSPEEALWLVAERGRLAGRLPEGGMLAVSLTESAARELSGEGLSLAAVNGPAQCVVAGGPEAVERAARRLAAAGVACVRLPGTRAFHTASVEPMLDEFAERLRRVPLRAPQAPYVSTLTGDWVTARQATDPDFWVSQLREPVRFADGVGGLLSAGVGIFLEVGPGRSLGSLVRRQMGDASGRAVLASIARGRGGGTDSASMLEALGRLWLAGVEPDWKEAHGGRARSRVSLPTYPFERRRYWVEPAAPEAHADAPTPPDRQARQEREPASAARAAGEGFGEAAPPEVAPDAPRSETERKIADIWREVFGLEQIGVEADFFELGGNSLTGLQIISRVRKAFDADLPMRSFFESPSIAGLARLIEERARAEEEELAAMEELLREIEAMSPEQLREGLGQELTPTGEGTA